MNSEFLANWSMVFLRASGLLAVFPIFSAPSIPVRIRVALGALLAFMVGPALPRYDWQELDLWTLLLRMGAELAVGLLFGYLAKIVFFALETAGSIISVEIGLNLPPSFSPLTSASSTVPGVMLNYLASVVWLSLDLHHWMLLGFQRTYDLLPIGQIHWHEPAMLEVLNWARLLFIIALQISAPVMAISFVISLVFSVLGRAVAQMNVFTESLGVRIFAGLLVFGWSLQLMALQIVGYLQRLPEDILRLAKVLAGYA